MQFVLLTGIYDMFQDVAEAVPSSSLSFFPLAGKSKGTSYCIKACAGVDSFTSCSFSSPVEFLTYSIKKML